MIYLQDDGSVSYEDCSAVNSTKGLSPKTYASPRERFALFIKSSSFSTRNFPVMPFDLILYTNSE